MLGKQGLSPSSQLDLLRGAGDLTPLTVSLPDWEELVEKDLSGQDFSALCGRLEEAFRAAAAERYGKYRELRRPVEFKLFVRPI